MAEIEQTKNVNGDTEESSESEFRWLLKQDVPDNMEQLKKILMECSTRFQMPCKDHECIVKSNEYSMSYCAQNQLDSIHIKTKLDGFKITNADISIKIGSKHPMLTIKTCINECPEHPFPWRLHQIQDAANYISYAIDMMPNKCDFQTAEEVTQLIDDLMNLLLKSRSSLLIPKRKSIEEILCSQNMQSVKPSLPIDFAISFYIQTHNLICSIYHLALTNNGPQIKAEYQSEVSISYLSEVLLFLSLGLQLCQQLKEKISVTSAPLSL